MHELSLTQNILHTAIRYAEKTDSRKVVTIVLRLGVLRDIKKEWIQRYFDYISKGTIAEDAEILVLADPLVCRCRDCGTEFEVDMDSLATEEIHCPGCTAPHYSLISGTKFLIEGIEVV